LCSSPPLAFGSVFLIPCVARDLMLRITASADLWSQYVSFAPWAWGGFVLLIILLLGAVLWVVYRRLSKRLGGRSDAEMMILKGLEESSAMTEEERRRVRTALARQYMRPAEEPAKGAAGLSPLQQLAIEAQRLEEEARLKAAQRAPQPPPLPDEAPPESARASSSPAEPDLPPMMRKLLGKSDIELEDMVAAGLLSEEDLEWVRRARGGQS